VAYFFVSAKYIAAGCPNPYSVSFEQRNCNSMCMPIK